jgi:hypothetical protein
MDDDSSRSSDIVCLDDERGEASEGVPGVSCSAAAPLADDATTVASSQSTVTELDEDAAAPLPPPPLSLGRVRAPLPSLSATGGGSFSTGSGSARAGMAAEAAAAAEPASAPAALPLCSPAASAAALHAVVELLGAAAAAAPPVAAKRDALSALGTSPRGSPAPPPPPPPPQEPCARCARGSHATEDCSAVTHRNGAPLPAEAADAKRGRGRPPCVVVGGGKSGSLGPGSPATAGSASVGGGAPAAKRPRSYPEEEARRFRRLVPPAGAAEEAAAAAELTARQEAALARLNSEMNARLKADREARVARNRAADSRTPGASPAVELPLCAGCAARAGEAGGRPRLQGCTACLLLGGGGAAHPAAAAAAAVAARFLHGPEDWRVLGGAEEGALDAAGAVKLVLGAGGAGAGANPYAVLALSRAAGEEGTRRRWKALCRLLHPDRVGRIVVGSDGALGAGPDAGFEERAAEAFKAVTKAYRELCSE